VIGEIGLSELFLIGFVVVLLTKPADLPVVMRRFGVVYAHVQTYVFGIWAGWQEKLGLFGDENQRSEKLHDNSSEGR
jgi:Sec-independent protein translocase protein TatA